MHGPDGRWGAMFSGAPVRAERRQTEIWAGSTVPANSVALCPTSLQAAAANAAILPHEHPRPPSFLWEAVLRTGRCRSASPEPEVLAPFCSRSAFTALSCAVSALVWSRAAGAGTGAAAGRAAGAGKAEERSRPLIQRQCDRLSLQTLIRHDLWCCMFFPPVVGDATLAGACCCCCSLSFCSCERATARLFLAPRVRSNNSKRARVAEITICCTFFFRSSSYFFARAISASVLGAIPSDQRSNVYDQP
jgi:hypothetical protein